MRAGGKYKRLANLPKAHHIDVRQEMAMFAGPGACARNVSNVKTILQTAHTRLIEALTRREDHHPPGGFVVQAAQARADRTVHQSHVGTCNTQGDPSVYRQA